MLTLGLDHLHAAETKVNIGSVYLSMHEYEKALTGNSKDSGEHRQRVRVFGRVHWGFGAVHAGACSQGEDAWLRAPRCGRKTHEHREYI